MNPLLIILSYLIIGLVCATVTYRLWGEDLERTSEEAFILLPLLLWPLCLLLGAMFGLCRLAMWLGRRR